MVASREGKRVGSVRSSTEKTEEGLLPNHQRDAPIHFMSPLSPQSDPPPQYFHKQLSGTSVALICVFFFCFIGIIYLSAKASRSTTRVLPASSSSASRLTARRRRPRLLEIWLDKHLGASVHNWRVSHSLRVSRTYCMSVFSPRPVHPHGHIRRAFPTILPNTAPCRVAQRR